VNDQVAVLTGWAPYLPTTDFTESCWVRWLENYQNGQRYLNKQPYSVTCTIILSGQCCRNSHPLECDTLLLDVSANVLSLFSGSICP